MFSQKSFSEEQPDNSVVFGSGSARQPTQKDNIAHSVFPVDMLYYDSTLTAYSGNSLPHWEAEAVVYHVSFRLVDSIPQARLRQWINERKTLLENAKIANRILSIDEVNRLQYLYGEHVEKYLDAGYGSCLLRQEAAAQIVKDSLEYYNKQKYLLHAWCIMPNHLHVIFQLLASYRQREVLFGWKSYTAHAINKALNRSGTLWQSDCYNHIIRTEREYYNQMWYVWNNPKYLPAEEKKWRWSCLQGEDC